MLQGNIEVPEYDIIVSTFFFQAEDGIRDYKVTGVQTCALPISGCQKSLQSKLRPKDINGFTPEQRFFLGWAQVWAQNIRPEAARLRNATDPHPLRSEEHTSELQSPCNLVCRLLLEKKKNLTLPDIAILLHTELVAKKQSTALLRRQ